MLENTQKAFLDSIFEQKLEPSIFISSTNPIERLHVYKKTILENCRHALEITFSGIWTLLGQECADGIAYAFLQDKKNFPKTGCLDDWGGHFPVFLEQQTSLKNLPYLKEYADYEWCIHLSYIAEDAIGMASEALSKLSEDQLENIKFIFLPSFYLFSAIYPLNYIEEIVKNPNALAIDLKIEEKKAIIVRPALTVLTFWIPIDQWTFLLYLKNRLSLKEAIEHTVQEFPNFNFIAILQWLLQIKCIQSIV